MGLKDPATRKTPAIDSSSGISYAISCAAERIPPMSVYLLLQAHPVVKTPIGAIEKAAITTNSPSGADEAAMRGEKGTNTRSRILEEMNITGPIV